MPIHLQEEYELVTMLLEREQSRLAGAATYSVVFKPEFTEVFMDQDVPDESLKAAIENCGDYTVSKVD